MGYAFFSSFQTMGESHMNEIGNIIAQLEAQKAAIEQALETLRDFETTGGVTPAAGAGK